VSDKPLDCIGVALDTAHVGKHDFKPNPRAVTDDPQQLRVEVALLRSSLWLSTRALEAYRDSPHKKIDVDDRPMMEVIVPESLPDKAADAIARANKLLMDKPQGREP